jgi:hypothetical protein
MAKPLNSTPPGVRASRFFPTAAARASAFAAAGEPFGVADFRGATVEASAPHPVPS